MAFLVVRMRGTVNVPFWALTTLKNLYLNKKFSATLVPETSDYLGMLRKINQWVAWSKADSEIVKTLIEKRGKKKTPKLDTQKESRRKDEYKGIDELVDVIVNDKIKFSDGGILGNNKDLLEIVKRMV